MNKSGINNAKVLLSTFVFIFGVQISEGTGVISLKFETFKNPNHRQINGKCCDDVNKNAATCKSGCDIYFVTCLSSSRDTTKCDHGELWMIDDGTFKDSGFTFGSSIEISDTDPKEYYSNPYQISFSRWSGIFATKIEVFDDDSSPDRLNYHRNEKIDEVTAVLPSDAAKNSTNATNHEFILNGVNVEMKISVRVVCNELYFIPNCTEYCNDNSGTHLQYKCNYDQGIKECLEGWYGKECSIKCLPRDDAFGHYKCNNTDGRKICLPGWCMPASNCTIKKNVAPPRAPLGKSPPKISTESQASKVNVSATSHASSDAIPATHTSTASTPKAYSLPPSHTQSLETRHFIPPTAKTFVTSHPSKTKEKQYDPNFIVYLVVILLSTAMLFTGLYGLWKLLPTFTKSRKVAPLESWQQTRRKRTISTKTGLPPMSPRHTTPVAVVHGIDTQPSPIGGKKSVIQVKSSEGAAKQTKASQNRAGRKVTFANSSYLQP